MNLREKVYSIIQPLSSGVQDGASGLYSALKAVSSLGTLSKVTRALPYGVSTRPAKNVWGYFQNLGGEILSPIIMAELDKLRPEPSAEGEVIFYCRDGAGFPVIITLKTDGNLSIKANTKVEVDCPEVSIKSDKIELGKASLEKIVNGESFKTLYNSHQHTFLGSPTEAVLPVGQMNNAHLSSVVKGAK